MKWIALLGLLVGCTPPLPVVQPPRAAYDFDWRSYNGSSGPTTQVVTVNGERFVVVSED